MSSAYFSNSTPAGIESFMSAMKSKKRTGPRTLPWMTPASTDFHSVVVVPIFTRCWRSVKYAAIQEGTHSGSCLVSFSSRILWSTRSNALAKSKNTACVDCCLSFASLQSSMTLIMASAVLLPGRKPYWLLFCHMCVVWLRMNVDTTRSYTLHRHEVRAIGR